MLTSNFLNKSANCINILLRLYIVYKIVSENQPLLFLIGLTDGVPPEYRVKEKEGNSLTAYLPV